MRPEASDLIFLDCRELGFKSHADLESFMINEARLALNSGTMFGEEGRGFMRLNAATPRPILEAAMKQLKEAVDKRTK